MWSVQCERCGAPAEVSIAPPRIVRCAACRTESPASPTLAARLEESAASVARIVARTRRLGGVGKSAVRFGTRLLVVLAALWLYAVAMLVIVGGLNVFYGQDGGAVARACVLLPLGATLVVTGGAALLDLRRRLAAIEGLAGAVPPRAPGEDASCPVCGGAVHVPTARAVVECGYCKSDVVVAPRVVEGAVRREVRGLELLEQTLVERERGLAAAALGRVLVVLGGGVVLAFGLAVCGGVVGALIDVGRLFAR